MKKWHEIQAAKAIILEAIIYYYTKKRVVHTRAWSTASNGGLPVYISAAQASMVGCAAGRTAGCSAPVESARTSLVWIQLSI